MAGYEIAGGIKNLQGGPLDTLRGPYADVATACAAIPNTVISGVNYRLGKTVEIGTPGNLVTYWWKGTGNFLDTDLVPTYNDAVAVVQPTIDVVNRSIQKDTANPIETKNYSTGALSLSTFGASTDIYAWGFPIGVKPEFKKIGLKIGTRGTDLTSVQVRIKEINASGTVLATKTQTVAVPASTGSIDLFVTLDASVISTKRLYMEVLGNAPLYVFRTGTTASIFTAAAGYPITVSSTTNNMSQTLPTSGSNLDIGSFAYEITYNIIGTSELTKIIQNTPLILPQPVSDASTVTNQVLKMSPVQQADFVSTPDAIGPQGGTFYGIGFPVGVIQNFDRVSVKIYQSASSTPAPTKIKLVLRKVNHAGAIVATAELTGLSLVLNANQLTWVFDSIVQNTAGDRLYLEMFSDGKLGAYRRTGSSGITFIAANGYPPFATTTTTDAYTTSALTDTATFYDFWFDFTQFVYMPAFTETGRTLFGTSGSSGGGTSLPANNKRFSFAGSSVTWGDGFLQSGFVRDAIKRIQLAAQTILPTGLAITGQTAKTYLTDRKLFYSTGIKIDGLNAEAAFSITGDELTICQQIQRNNTNASVMQVYADNVLIGTFNNFNNTAIGTATANFTGDGTTTKFDLGRCFTFGHTLTVGGVSKVIDMNTQGSSYAFPGTTDAVIVRKYGNDSNGKPVVHHWVYFKVAPASGAAIVIPYSYGEEISYEKTTVGKTATGILESSYGDGDLSFDTTAPTAVSSGLDFRRTDDRSIVQFRFTDNKTRAIRIKISGNYGSASGTPYFTFNFATNKFYHFQNAGIGGYEIFALANNLDIENNLSWQRITEFRPDYLIIDTAPNEDWNVQGHKLYTSFAGTSLTDLRRQVTMPLRTITYNSGPDNYDWTRWVGKISAIDDTSVTLQVDSTHVVATNPVQGDLMLIGSYYGDNRECIARIVDTYNSTTKKITFLNPIAKSEHIYSSVQDFVGQEVRVRDMSVYTAGVTTIVNKIKGVMPELKVAFIPNPLPNINARELWGYELILNKFCKTLDYTTLRSKFFEIYQKSQVKDVSFTIAASSLLTDPITGYKYALLPAANGANTIFPEILVNGVDVHGAGAYLENGWSCRPDPAKTGAALNKIAGNKTNTNQATNSAPPKLVFVANAPTSGNIIVNYSSALWSLDSCHISTLAAEYMYGELYASEFLLK